MNKNLETFLIYFVVFVTSLSQVFRLIYFMIMDGVKILKVNPRDTQPPILNDQRFGTHHYIKLKQQGVKLHYVQKGDSSKPLMLCLHGFPECWLSWRHQLQEFSSKYWVVAVDMRGYGESDKPNGKQNYTPVTIAEDIRELITSLGKSQCILMGHDWGGSISWILVDRFPEMFSEFICIEGPHLGVTRTLLKTNIWQFLGSWYIFFFQCPFLPEILKSAKDLALLTDHLRGRKNLVQAFPDDVIQGYHYYYSKKGAFTAPINYYRTAFQFDPTPTNGKIKVPTLILWGEDDRSLTTAVPNKIIPICEDVEYEELKKTDHFAHEENPKEVNERIWKYLNTKRF